MLTRLFGRLAGARQTGFCNDGSAPLQVPGFGEGSYRKLPFAARYSTPFDYARHPNVTVRELSVLRAINEITEQDGWAEAVLCDDTETISAWRTQASAASELINDQAWTWILRELHDKAKAFLASQSVLVLNTGAMGVLRYKVDPDNARPLETWMLRVGPAGFSVYKSDALIAPSVMAELKQGMSSFFESDGDHGLVYQVNPSMYPLTYQRTPVLVNAGQTVSLYGKLSKGFGSGTPSRGRSFQDHRNYTHCVDSDFSEEFQWLPCEVEFRNKGRTAITSYINNLDPKRFAHLYQAIEKIISLSIEPWNQVIVEAGRGRTPFRILSYGVEYSPPRIFRDLAWVQDPDILADEEIRKSAQDYIEDYCALPGNHLSNDEEHDGSSNGAYDWKSDWEDDGCHGSGYVLELHDRWSKRRSCPDRHPQMGGSLTYDAWKAGDIGPCVVSPTRCGDPLATLDPDYVFTPPPPVVLQKKFQHKGLQVVVKMSSIELSPRDNVYEAADWAVEGMADEHIVAVAQYFYSVENIDHPGISFLHTGRWNPHDYEFNEEDYVDLCQVLGIGWDDVHESDAWSHRIDNGQFLGTVPAREGRLLAYPNHLMTRVEKCELKDKNKPGHIRSLTLCLVDPHYRICSTRNVLPQQPDVWFPQALRAILPSGIRLPVELQWMVRNYTDSWPLSGDEATTIGMKPRKPALVREEQKWWGCYCI